MPFAYPPMEDARVSSLEKSHPQSRTPIHLSNRKHSRTAPK